MASEIYISGSIQIAYISKTTLRVTYFFQKSEHGSQKHLLLLTYIICRGQIEDDLRVKSSCLHFFYFL